MDGTTDGTLPFDNIASISRSYFRFAHDEKMKEYNLAFSIRHGKSFASWDCCE